MSCKDCEAAREIDVKVYFRWRNANILIGGCNKHMEEVLDVLRNHHEHTDDAVQGIRVKIDKGLMSIMNRG